MCIIWRIVYIAFKLSIAQIDHKMDNLIEFVFSTFCSHIILESSWKKIKVIIQIWQVELSSAKLSSLSWGWAELSWDWVELRLSWVELRLIWSWIWVETELDKYLNSSIKVLEVFNWSIWSLVPFYYFPSGWLGGWLCYLKIRLSQPQS